MTLCDYELASFPCNLQITEALDSRSQTVTGLTRGGQGVNETWELHLFVQGTNDECTVRKRLEPGQKYGLPETFPSFGPAAAPQGGALQSYPLRELRVSRIGWELWEVVATYAWNGPVNRNVFRLSFPTQIAMSTRGGNAKLSQSIRTLQSYPQLENPGGAAENPAPDFEGAIEWDGRQVNGVDVPAPITRYSEVWIFPRDRIFNQVTTGEQHQDGRDDGKLYKATWDGGRYQVWQNYTGCVHGTVHQKPRDGSGIDKSPQEEAEDAAYRAEPSSWKQKFRGWSPGEVMLDNVNLRQIGLHHFEVSFDFLVQSNRVGLRLPWSVEDYMSVMRDVEGWDHIWSYYEQTSKPAQTQEATPQEYQVTAPEPQFVYVERIHERRNFIQLDIGNAAFSGQILQTCASSTDLMTYWNNLCGR